MLSALLYLVLAQVEPADAANALLVRMTQSDDEDREAARYLLTQLEPSFAPSLRKMIPFQVEAGARSASREAASVLYDRWGWQLYRKGQVEQALIRFAESTEAPDAEAWIRRRLEKPLWYVNLWMPEQPIHGVVLDDGWRKFAEDILKYYGPWGMAAVLRVTRDEDRSDGAWRTLSHMGEEVVPVLLRELASANLDRHESAINALESVIFRAVRSKGTLQTCRAAIEVVAGNSLESEHTRARAKDLLGWLPRER